MIRSILHDPEYSALEPCRGRNVTYVRENVKLDVVFKEFMTSANHMLLVRREPDMPGRPRWGRHWPHHPGRCDGRAHRGEASHFCPTSASEMKIQCLRVKDLVMIKGQLHRHDAYMCRLRFLDESDIYEDVNRRLIRRDQGTC